MDQMDVLYKWWADPEALIVPAGETDQIIEWLAQQTPDTWHQVVMSWNYDYGDRVLSWILAQENCDQGTAARIFLVEGVGYWLWDVLADVNVANDKTNVCRLVLDNWHRYTSAELKPEYKDIPDQLIESLKKIDDDHYLSSTPFKEIMAYEGTREPSSKYASDDGKIVIALDHWMEAKGIEITS
ncbi:protein of unknown function [Pseudovibrio denitrificans]|uniref:DUF4274 domain-containing protein n=1 Tax=Pseudovibrio denitrificans TaxID=258256 RepID=A0A1I7DQG1_9HYPH|nr:DUF4274 domain-containing protein [Pseudovibrio denitrificans]SFU13938.1 protein of unknown function [Pseudovibrio denitrificans]